MATKKRDSAWDIEGALRSLRARVDPYIWEQGQELHRRGAVEDAQQGADGAIHVQVLDPRDARKFFVDVTKDREGVVTARCACPYRLGGLCRHQVAGLQFLLEIAGGGRAAEGAEGAARPAGAEAGGGASPARAAAEAPQPVGPVLYRLFDGGGAIKTAPDGSLLRVALHTLGSLRAPTRVALQLFTGSGWTEVRTPDVERWTSRGAAGPHPRDAAVAALLEGGGDLRRELDPEALAALLAVLAGSGAFVDRTGRELPVSRWPWTLAARIVRAPGGAGVAVELACRSPQGGWQGGSGGGSQGESRPFAEVSLVASAAPWIQLETGAFHPLDARAPGPALAELQEEDLSKIEGDGIGRLLSRGVEALERITGRSVEIEPGVVEEVEAVSAARVRLEGTPARLTGKLELRYGDEWIAAPATPEPWTVTRGGKVHRYPPAHQSLARARRELETLGFRRGEEGWLIERPGALAAVLAPRIGAFVRLELSARLEALNLVERAPVLRLRVGPGPVAGPGAAGAGGTGLPDGGVVPRAGSGIAWLEVEASLADGDRVLPVDLGSLREAFTSGGGGRLQLGDGTVLSLDHPALRALRDLLESGTLLEPGPGGAARVKVPLHAACELLEESPGREVELALQLRDLVDGLRGAGPEPFPVRREVEEVLRPYQREAVRWLGRLAAWGLGGLLADEMGLGKTVMTLAHLFGRSGGAGPGAGRGTALVVCPSSLVFNWLEECRRFFPEARAAGLYGLGPKEREERIREGADLLVTSYALLRRDREALEARELRAVVLDEAQHIKNAESQTAQAAFALRAGERWALTGTPVENRLGDLWSCFHFLLPGLLGSGADFEERYAEPIARREEEPLARLRARVKPFVLRRTKAQVLTELPPRIDQVERVPMTEVQKRVYEAFLREARAEVQAEDSPRARMLLLAALTRLRQVCCHPGLVLDEKERSALAAEGLEVTGGKFELLLELIDECVEEGHRVLLYSQFTSMLDLIEARLEERGVKRSRLDGSTRDREGAVGRFARDPSVPVFLISLKAGGFGLNLTQADTVILYDPWWNPAAEDQAAARAHRMGQTLPVHVHKLVTLGSVEEKILELQARKRDLAESVLASDEEAVQALTLEDLRGLLE